MTGFCNKQERFLYFQNVYFEIEWAAKFGDRSSKRKTQYKPDLKLLTPLVAWDKNSKGNEMFKDNEDFERYKDDKDYDILCCDKEGHIRIISRSDNALELSESWNIETMDGSSTRFAVDQLNRKLIYQSKLGDIRGVEIGGQDLVGDLLVASKQVSEEIDPREIAPLRDEHSPQGSSSESRRDF
ncbi:Monooxygenase [Lasiodiplodia theobromae]|uniref:Uncharacterized protein n=1 Tax=Lasiodiplodia theobromae TaxID=45133 RepID=A0A5N5CWY8_9PEZI|nr:Monooxygenase [Lasiodiplodia theobromae]KAB2569880.1 hypothetical protein DBV05_g11461 [Lasiodiplodia theobromae]KAF4534416.1 Monooxygenase [Lasiodiplodia theobromae]